VIISEALTFDSSEWQCELSLQWYVSLSLYCGRVSTTPNFSSDFSLLYGTQTNTPLLHVLKIKALVELGATQYSTLEPALSAKDDIHQHCFRNLNTSLDFPTVWVLVRIWKVEYLFDRYASGPRSTLWMYPLELPEIPVPIEIIGPTMLP